MAEPDARQVAILAALTGELDRQLGPDAGRVDAQALAAAVDRALGTWSPPEIDDLSKEPDELNANNDG